MGRLAVVVIVALGCGRIGFSARADGSGDGGGGGGGGGDAGRDAPPDAPGAAPLIQIIDDVGEASGVLIALDAGDASSYDGSSQIWVNTAGSAGTSFTLGADATVAADDPTFSGVAGGLDPSELFTLDGAAWFQQAATAWPDAAFHMDGGAYTILGVEDATGSVTVFSDCRCSTHGVNTPGVVVYTTGSGAADVYQEGDTNMGFDYTSSASALGGWHLYGVTSEAGGSNGTNTIQLVVDRTIQALADQSEFYGAGAADRPAAIGAEGGGMTFDPAGTQVAMIAVWNRALSAAELTALYDAIKVRRFPTLP